MELLSFFFKKRKADKRETNSQRTLTNQDIASEISWLEAKWAIYRKACKKQVAHCFMMVAREKKYTPEEMDILKKIAKRHGDSVEILEGYSKAYSEKRFEEVLKEMKNENLIKNGYDYAWFRWLIQHDCLMVNRNLKTKSDEAYCLYLKSIRINDVPDRSVINRYYKLMECNHPPYTRPFIFQDCYNDPQERERRNNLIEVFMKRMMA